MRCSQGAEGRVAARAPAAWILLLLTAVLLAAQAHAAAFKVRSAQLRQVNGVYLVDAHINFDFSDESVEALKSGVPLTVIVDMQVVRERTLLWDETVAERRARFRLQVHSLSGRYMLKNLDSGHVRSFSTVKEAKAALGTLTDFPILRGKWLDPDQHYRLRIRARLDVEALPSPLRPLAYLSSLWDLGGDWYVWPIKP